mmetsp:Transcript_6692/g.17017  ORF Transcript_6692/g.17017 Transcript_6692/m.17017 type:complete len:233 (+) Transcript_6692:711-1409(+)
MPVRGGILISPVCPHHDVAKVWVVLNDPSVKEAHLDPAPSIPFRPQLGRLIGVFEAGMGRKRKVALVSGLEGERSVDPTRTFPDFKRITGTLLPVLPRLVAHGEGVAKLQRRTIHLLVNVDPFHVEQRGQRGQHRLLILPQNAQQSKIGRVGHCCITPVNPNPQLLPSAQSLLQVIKQRTSMVVYRFEAIKPDYELVEAFPVVKWIRAIGLPRAPRINEVVNSGWGGLCHSI